MSQLSNEQPILLLQEKIDAFIPPNQQLISLRSTQTIEEALDIFIEKQIKQAPVIDEIDGNQTCQGFLSILELVKIFADEVEQLGTEHVASYFKTQFSFKTVGDYLKGLSERGDFFSRSALLGIASGETVEKCIMAFGKGLDCIALADSNDTITNVVSKLDVVYYLRANLSALGYLQSSTPHQLDLLKKVITTTTSTPVLKAFKLMADHTVSALGVVDESGVIVSTLTATSLKALKQLGYPLHLNVIDFIKEVSKVLPERDSKCITCQATTPLNSIIGTLASEKLERLYVVDKDNKPIGIVSLTDICAKVYLEVYPDK